MGTPTGQFTESRFGAFVESPLKARNSGGFGSGNVVPISCYGMAIWRQGFGYDWNAVFASGGSWGNRLVSFSVSGGSPFPNRITCLDALGPVQAGYIGYGVDCYRKLTVTVKSTPDPTTMDGVHPATGSHTQTQLQYCPRGFEFANSVDDSGNVAFQHWTWSNAGFAFVPNTYVSGTIYFTGMTKTVSVGGSTVTVTYTYNGTYVYDGSGSTDTWQQEEKFVFENPYTWSDFVTEGVAVFGGLSAPGTDSLAEIVWRTSDGTLDHASSNGVTGYAPNNDLPVTGGEFGAGSLFAYSGGRLSIVATKFRRGGAQCALFTRIADTADARVSVASQLLPYFGTVDQWIIPTDFSGLASGQAWQGCHELASRYTATTPNYPVPH
jgi:hypothetical protein